MVDNIFWLGHSTVKIKGDKVIYFDPWKIDKAEKADIILISHSHYDHLSPEDVKKIQKEDTVIFTAFDCVSKLSGDVRGLKPGDKANVDNIVIEAVPSYNENKNFHPRANNWIGFIVTMKGKRIYYTGDTDFVPEMRELKADIVIMPVGGTYTMTAQEAAEAVNLIQPELAIPIHYGDIVGSSLDAETFKSASLAPVIIKPRAGG